MNIVTIIAAIQGKGVASNFANQSLELDRGIHIGVLCMKTRFKTFHAY